MKKDLWVVIPGYNEESHIEEVVRRAKKHTSHTVVVDDGSIDKTSETAERQDVHVLRHIINLGKGAAAKTGCDYAFSHGAGIMMVIDADGQHNPDDIPRFVQALQGVDMVFGYRKFSKNMPFLLRFGNRFINRMTKLLFRMDLKDTQCGYRAFSSDAYKKIRWRASDYFMESEMIANAGKHRLKYKEIPIETVYSNKYKGTTVMDGVKIVFNMLLWKLRMRNF
ncbi:glycosyltransferase [Candidatus Woesearchaeota archaeon]|nr:glycosyltransferase [Candidatus Woesearchaeota archaeon]